MQQLPNSNSTPTVSIIIPAYNAEATLDAALESAQKQTYEHLEILVVDDGSNDSTAKVAAKRQQSDPRIKLLAHEGNLGRLEARRTGIEAASGQYTLFLDADDVLDAQTCEVCLAQVAPANKQFDIVQFGIDIHYTQTCFKEDRDFDNWFCQPPDKEAFGSDVTHVIFLWREAPWSLCAKLFKTSVLKKAIAHIPKSSLTLAEDACICFIASYYAKGYKGLPSFRGYHYNIDAGGSGAKTRLFSAEQFSKMCDYATSMNCLKSFLNAQPDGEKLAQDFATVSHEHLNSLVDKVLNGVLPEDRPTSYRTLCERFSVPEVVSCMAQLRWNEPFKALHAIQPRLAFPAPAAPVRCIGIYYWRLHTGGLESVTSQLINLWVNMGYEVVLLCEEGPNKADYPIPAQVKRVIIKHTAETDANNYLERARQIEQAIKDYNIDTLLYNHWLNRLLPWDMLVAQAAGARVLSHTHSSFLILNAENFYNETTLCGTYQHLDGIVTLSDTDRAYWGFINPNTFQVENPLTIKPAPGQRAALEGNEIIWIGRLSPFDKCPQEAVRIMAYVHEAHPEVTLTFVGADNDEFTARDLREQVQNAGLSECITFAGEQSDVTPYLKRASIFLLSSKWEGWCLSLAESKVFGLPCVMYELPYLALAKGNKGIVSVQQNDAKAAAYAICDLLENRTQLKALGEDAWRHGQELESFDAKGAWQGIFKSLENPRPRTQAADGWSVADGIARSMELQRQKQDREAGALRAQIDEARRAHGEAQRMHEEETHRREQAELATAEIQNSTSYKLGKVLLAAPCAIKDKLRHS